MKRMNFRELGSDQKINNRTLKPKNTKYCNEFRIFIEKKPQAEIKFEF